MDRSSRPHRRSVSRLIGGAAMAVVALAGSLALSSAGSASATTGAIVLPQSALGWGYDFYGQVGDGTFSEARVLPVSVVSPAGIGQLFPVQQLAAGGFHSLAVLPAGTVWTWGLGNEGQLGNNKGTTSSRPVPVAGPGGVGQLAFIKAVAGGGGHSLGLGSNGLVWSWGSNNFGQLGNGSNTGPQRCANAGNVACSKVAVAVVGSGGTGRLSGITSIAAGDNHSLALRSDGTVWAWGENDEGELGTGTSTGPQQCATVFGPAGCSKRPVEVVGPSGSGHLTNVVALAASESSSIAVRSDGTVWAWGSNRFNELGQGNKGAPETCHPPLIPAPTPCSTKPVEVVGPGGQGSLGGVISASANGSVKGTHVSVLRSDRTVWSWGYDAFGQLGNGAFQLDSSEPVQAVGPGGIGHLDNVAQLVAGGDHTVALRSNGTMWAWGLNDFGQLGTGNRTGPQRCTVDEVACSTSPIQVKGPGGKAALGGIGLVGAGALHSLAVSRVLQVPS